MECTSMHSGLQVTRGAFTVKDVGMCAYGLPEIRARRQGAIDFHRILCFRQSGMAAIGKRCRS